MTLQTQRNQTLLQICLFTLALAIVAIQPNGNIKADTAMTAAIELFEQGQFGEARTGFETLREQQAGAVPSYYLGRISEQQGDFETAAEYMAEAAELDPPNSVYHQKLGEYYGTVAGNASVFKKMGLAKKSKSSFEKAVALDGSNLDARSGLVTYYLQAPGIAGGSEEKALEQSQEIFRQDPARGHAARAQVYQHQKNFAAVEREYRAAIELDPEEGNSWLALGIFLTGQERYDDALVLYRERLAAMPDDMPVTYQLGRTVSISGQSLNEGRAAFERYISQYQPTPDDPGLDWAHYRLGLIYQQLGEKESAKGEYEKALAINDDHPEAARALKKLK